jgi:hypothetical protein
MTEEPKLKLEAKMQKAMNKMAQGGKGIKLPPKGPLKKMSHKGCKY